MNNIPEGFKLVPVEPTKEMVVAGLEQLGGCVGSCGEASPPEHSDIIDVFSGMLAAAPTPPQPIYSALNFVCTALPGPGNECAFVELENDAGESLGHGEWRNRDDGLVELHIAAPQPIYDEAKERELFEAFYSERAKTLPLPLGSPIRYGGGQYVNDFALFGWLVWLECAQSRAKAGETGHE